MDDSLKQKKEKTQLKTQRKKHKFNKNLYKKINCIKKTYSKNYVLHIDITIRILYT